VIGALLAAAVALAPADVLARYAAALAKVRTPVVLTFEYTLDQTGTRNGEQVHRVFRSGSNERDELLVADGRKLAPPSVHVFHDRPNRYTLERLAPQPAAYAFHFVGMSQSGHAPAYEFATEVRSPSAFRVTSVTIDAASFVPTSIAFATGHDGRGTVTFARFDRYWMPNDVNVRATYGNQPMTEHIAFSKYRFPDALPPATFAAPRLSEDAE
jgi:hypothetical protein